MQFESRAKTDALGAEVGRLKDLLQSARLVASEDPTTGLPAKAAAEQATFRNRYMVVAGRRLLALCQLQDSGKLPAKYQVPCRLAPEDADLTESSERGHIANATEDMDPLDECSKFATLIESGKSAVDIAVRFGYTQRTVERRLALARLSPVLHEADRAGQSNMNVL